MTTRFRQAHLEGTSRRFSDLETAAEGSFDLTLFFSSWDSRCVAVTRASKLKTRHCGVVLFDIRDHQGHRDRHDLQLVEYAKRISEKVTVINGRSTDVDGMWQKLLDLLLSSRNARQRPLRVLLDASTCPRCYIGALIAACLNGSIAAQVSILYAEGKYPETAGEPEIAFTGGRWETIAIPGLGGITDPGKDRFLLVSVGFEGAKTLQAVSAVDPDRVSLLFPDPGYQPSYTDRARDVNTQLIREYCIPIEQIIAAPAGDAIAAWEALARSPRERRELENTSYLCSGTKPHAIALALRAMALRYPAVLYNVPGEHRVVLTEPSGVFWRYDIRDVTALPPEIA